VRLFIKKNTVKVIKDKAKKGGFITAEIMFVNDLEDVTEPERETYDELVLREISWMRLVTPGNEKGELLDIDTEIMTNIQKRAKALDIPAEHLIRFILDEYLSRESFLLHMRIKDKKKK